MDSFTANQQRAITAPGNVLVVAGAGAGKTSTLVERCAHFALQAEPPVRLDQMLVVTFTEAAAAEVKARLRQRLLDALTGAQRVERRGRLEEQLALLDVAAIGTLHAFCLRLVREHFHELELDPQVVVLTGEQGHLLRTETLEAVLEAHYTDRTPRSTAVQQLVEVFGRGDDRRIRDLVWRLHTYAQTLPDPEGWFERQLAAYRQPQPVQWQGWLDGALAEWRERWVPVLAGQPAENHRAHEFAARLRELPSGATRRHFAEVLAAVVAADASWERGFPKSRFRNPIEGFYDDAAFLHSVTVGAGEYDPLAEDWQWTRGHMETLLELAREFAAAFAAAKRDQAGVDFHDLEQFALRLLWDRASDAPTPLARSWRQRFRLVFVDEYQDINPAQDQIIRALSGDGQAANRFLVGDVKQCIYRFRLSDPRVFQAYREAWSDPRAAGALADDEDRAPRAGGGVSRTVRRTPPPAGRVLWLPENFRSHEMLLRFVNRLFADVMSRRLGGVDYGAEEALQFGAAGERAELTAARDASPRVEVHLCLPDGAPQAGSNDGDGGGADAADTAELTRTEQEARVVALQLRRLYEARTPVWDKEAKTFRPMRWTDAAVLLRAIQGKAEVYAREFQRVGVPLEAVAADFYDSAEVLDLLSLLHLLDNPLQDLPLLAVLRSPLVGLSLDELAGIRLAAPDAPWWTALRRWAVAHGVSEAAPPDQSRPSGGGSSPPLAAGGNEAPVGSVNDVLEEAGAPEVRPLISESARRTADHTSTGAEPASADVAARKVRTFLDRFVRWRRLARAAPLSQQLEAILNETLYGEWLASQPRGAQRVANVQRLLALAEQFDPFQRQGIARFLRFVQAQQDAGLGDESAAGDDAQAVRLMTIHKSKGLEYPMVILADLGRRFNLRDLNGPVILDEEYGLCPQVRPPQGGAYPSLPYWRAKQRQRRELLGEEMRLLYVAMTRARDRLLLVGSGTRTGVEQWSRTAEPLAPSQLESASSCLDWLGPWWTRQIGRAKWWQEDRGATAVFEWQIHRTIPPDFVEPSRSSGAGDRPDAQGETTSLPAHLPPPSPDAAVRELQSRLHWQYPRARATVEVAKRSVTALARRALEEDEEAAPVFRWGSAAQAKRRLPTPSFALRPASEGGEVPSGRQLSATERGLAHHLFLQRVCLSRTGDEASLGQEVGRLVAAGVLTEAEAAALDLGAIRAFWTSEPGRRLRAHAPHVHRELPFTARLSAADLATVGVLASPDTLAGEFFVIQGVADLAAILPEAIWLVDFKTDQLTAAELPAKIAAYRPQLQLYALALSRIYRRPVSEAWLHFLSVGRSVAMHG